MTLMRLHSTRDQWAGLGAPRGWTLQTGAPPGAQRVEPRQTERKHARTKASGGGQRDLPLLVRLFVYARGIAFASPESGRASSCSR